MQTGKSLPCNVNEEKAERPQLLSVNDFQRRCPVNLRWAIAKYHEDLVQARALFKLGSKLLIDEDAFWQWLRKRGHQEAVRS
jgi:hypothetical protein